MKNQDLKALLVNSLAYAKQQGADQTDAYISQEKGFSVSARSGDVETIEYHQEQAYSISFYQGQRCASVSTTELNKPAIEALIDKAKSLVAYADVDPYAGLPEPDQLAMIYPDLDLYHPWDITPQQAVDLAVECEVSARDQDLRLTDAEGASVSTYIGSRFYANSHGFLGGYQTSRHSIDCQVVAKDGEDMQRDFAYTVARHANDLEDVSVVAKRAATKVLGRLQPQQVSTQQCPVIFRADVAKSLLGSFIAAISGGNLYRKNTFLLDQLGQAIFPTHINIYQEPHLLRALGSRPFDQDGVRTVNQHYVRDGSLESYVLGTYSARRLGLISTGNAGGVANLSITHSDYSLEALCREMGTGLLVTELIGQGVRLITGDYSRGASGFWIENGEIQFPVSEVTIAGNLKSMYAGIIAIGNDIDYRSNICTGSIWIDRMTVAGGS